MAQFYTPILTGAPATAQMFNSPLQQLDNAIAALYISAWFNVKAPVFGAVGNGVANDTAPLLAAIAAAQAAGGGTVFLPPGNYLIDATLDFSNLKGVILEGAGQGISGTKATTIMTTSNIPILTFGKPTATDTCLFNIVRDLQLYGSSTGAAQRGILLDGTGSFWTGRNKFENITIYNMGGDGVRFVSNAYTNSFTGCAIQFCNGNGVSVVTEGNANTFRECVVSNNTGDGFNLDGATLNFRIVDCDIEENTGCGINITDANCEATYIVGTYLEANVSHAIVDTGTATVYIGGRNQSNNGAVDGFQAAGNGGLLEGVQFAGTQRYSINLSGTKYVAIRNKLAATTTSHINYGGSAHLIADENNAFTQSMTVKNPSGNSSFSIDSTSAIATLSLKDTGTTVFGIQKDASSNFNLVNAAGQPIVKAKGATQRWYSAALGSAPTDADIPTSFISFYLDEAGHNLKVRVRYADGTTLKTGTLALT